MFKFICMFALTSIDGPTSYSSGATLERHNQHGYHRMTQHSPQTKRRSDAGDDDDDDDGGDD